MILVNLMENGDEAGGPELDAVRARLKDLEQRVQAGLREMDSPSVKVRRLDRAAGGGVAAAYFPPNPGGSCAIK